MPVPKPRRTRRVKGMPGVRLPLPRKPHQRHADKRTRPPKHKKKTFEGD
jgi:hypothetical protein